MWTRRAQADRQAIREFIATDNPAAALTLDELLSEKADRLVDRAALSRPGRVDGSRELIAHQSHILIYDVPGDLVRESRGILLTCLRK